MASENLSDVVECRVHPAIGIMRIGNSPDEHFLGPEIPGSHPQPEGGFKDPQGRVKRQAARFRLYGYDRHGQVICELTEDVARVQWRVELANKKAAWYVWRFAPDIPEAKGELNHPASRGPIQMTRRNPGVADRGSLMITPVARVIAGRSVNADGSERRYAFDDGRFEGIPVELGEIRTDPAGRLIVLGGFGRSESSIPGRTIRDRLNNNNWFDDTSDGPVEAVATLPDGRRLRAVPGWAVCAPTNYGPGVRSVVTAYDLIAEVAIGLNPSRDVALPTFWRHIAPLFQAFDENQWVSAGFLRDFGWGVEGSPFSPQAIERWSRPDPDDLAARQDLFLRFRRADHTTMNFADLPQMYGDGFDIPAKDPRQWLAVTALQYRRLQQWADGDFVTGEPWPAALDAAPVEMQAAALDEAALENCIGGSFNPGHELPFCIRQPLLYAAPFRFRRRGPDAPTPSRARARVPGKREPDYGPLLDSAITLSVGGPLSATEAGDLTRWMPLPWQADAATCGNGFEPQLDPFLPTFWPARLPNEVLAWQTYQRIIDPDTPAAEREQLFRNRAGFFRSLPSGFLSAMRVFNEDWSRFGILTAQPVPSEDSALPDSLLVETGNDHVDG